MDQKEQKLLLTRELRARVHRRAYSLSQAEYDALVYTMLEALHAGAMKPADIEAWRPAMAEAE